jgi:uncharacterized protein DUF4169
MAKIINLRNARKNKKRAEEARLAEANRAKFGESKSVRHKSKADQKNLEALLDGAKISDDTLQSDEEKD